MAEAAEGTRRLLAAIEAGELTCSPAYRNRLEGAVVALEALSAPGKSEGTTAPGSGA